MTSPLGGEVVSPITRRQARRPIVPPVEQKEGPSEVASTSTGYMEESVRSIETVLSESEPSSEFSLEHEHSCSSGTDEAGEYSGMLPWLPSIESSFGQQSTGIFSENEWRGSNAVESLPARLQAREEEARRMADMIDLFERGRLSQRRIKRALRTRAINSNFTYDVIMGHIRRRSGIKLRCLWTCPDQHAAVDLSRASYVNCPAQGCGFVISENTGHRYWYILLSDVIRALCREKGSFIQFMEGCERAKRAIDDEASEFIYDYYDGKLFRQKHRERMRQWDSSQSLHIFFTMSADGFEVFRKRVKMHNAWPVTIVILNLEHSHRAKASNAVITSFIPGSHDSSSFDSFLEPIVNDLAMLEDGMDVTCADGVDRQVQAFLSFFTFDWPAATKVIGFCDHNSRKPCRDCHKKSIRAAGQNRNYLIPIGNQDLCDKAAGLVGDSEGEEWIKLECAVPRTDHEIRRTWNMLNDDTLTAAEKAKLIRDTGIKRKPIVSKLSVDFAKAVPYDPMHSILLGWVKHLLRLCIGAHPKTEELESSFVVCGNKICLMNDCLGRAAEGIPSSWGRTPLSFHELSSYKAEDFKSLGICYASVLFSGDGIDARIGDLWIFTASIMFIVFNPTPRREDIVTLRKLVRITHALFTQVFYLDEDHCFCFTPITHALLHLPDMLENCGPLTNVCQFITERLVGEIGSLVQSRRHPEANLMKKSHTLLCLRIMMGGVTVGDDVQHTDSDTESDEGEYSYEMESDIEDSGEIKPSNRLLGAGKVVKGRDRERQAYDFIRHELPLTASEVELLHVKRYSRARLNKEGRIFDVETVGEFNRRRRRGTQFARQKCWVAGIFKSEQESASASESDVSQCMDCEVFYGSIDEVWELKIQYRSPHEQITIYRRFIVARIDWQNGLSMDFHNQPYALLGGKGRRGSVRDRWRTVENIRCIDRVIGYLDYLDRRYFLDNHRPPRGFNSLDGVILSDTKSSK